MNKPTSTSGYDVIHRSRRTRGVLAQGDMHAAERAIVGRGPRDGRFDVVVLCAEELDRDFRDFCGVFPPRCRIVRAPFDDGPVTLRAVDVATRGAKSAADAYRRGARVLVTCRAGRNRSGLVLALALHLASGCGGRAATEIVKARRIGAKALTNDAFVTFLSNVPPREDHDRGYLSKVG